MLKNDEKRLDPTNQITRGGTTTISLDGYPDIQFANKILASTEINRDENTITIAWDKVCTYKGCDKIHHKSAVLVKMRTLLIRETVPIVKNGVFWTFRWVYQEDKKYARS